MDSVQLMAMATAVGWASGLRLYAVLLALGASGLMGWVQLPGDLAVLSNPWVVGASAFMFALEFFIDKIPGLDSVWDAIHTFVRIPAGAALAMGVLGIDQGTWSALAAVVGGTLAATSHTAKASTRAAANTSPEPFSNLGLSLAGDALVPSALWMAWNHPVEFLICLSVAVVIMLVLIWWLMRFLRGLVQRIRGLLTGTEPTATPSPKEI